jgi:prepilin-type N-terminal cleavage/methylation domain-containing protein
MMRNQKGFTLIELLIVVVIIGILAAIAIPRFGKTREKAYVAAMQSDLKQVMTMQEMYYGDPLSGYTYWEGDLEPGVAPTKEDGKPAFQVATSTGVEITVELSNDGWNASATHTAAPTVTCDVYVGGTATVVGGGHASAPGVIACGDKAAGSDPDET